MLDSLIAVSLRNRILVVVIAIALLIWGGVAASRMPVDVFPDLTAPTVTVLTEAHGMAPQEVESLVTFPIETALNGATNVRRVRSSSGIGISVVWVEFEWGTDIYQARQMVNEKLQLAAANLPPDVPRPALAPVSSIMGEIMFMSLESDKHSGLDVRSVADWTVRRRILAVPGVSQVIPIGGGVKQFQVVVQPDLLGRYGVTFDQVIESLKTSNQNTSGGFYVESNQEMLIRGLGRISDERDIAATTVAVRNGQPIRIEQVAMIEVGPALKRGEGSVNGKPAVVIGILKQPGANTLELTKRLDGVLDEIQAALPTGMQVNRANFRQSDFISTSVRNVEEALRDGAILVVAIIFLFLLNVRATFITLTAIPLSLVVAIIVLKAMGDTINTMTLGGLTIAIGALVDDAIIGVENVFRRLRENRQRPESERQPALAMIYQASREVRGSIFFATLIIMLVFVPLFFLSGVEGRLLQPLGVSYLVAIFASMLVALTLTPVLCYYLLGSIKPKEDEQEGFFVRFLKRLYRPALHLSLTKPILIIALATLLMGLGVALFPFLGRAFLPSFNEGALTISAVTLPGTALAKSDQLGRNVEQVLLSFPEVVSTSRRTGRAELDEHAQGSNASEIDVVIKMRDRSKEAFLAELRKSFSQIPGVVINIGQPISHRIDHMLSGTRSNIAIKLFGDDLHKLRSFAKQIETQMATVPGLVDLSIEQQIDIPQLWVQFDREAIARYGLTSGHLSEVIEAAFQGHVATQILDGQQTYDLLVRYPDDVRQDQAAIANTLIDTPTGGQVPLKMLATVKRELGPNTISRENVQRKIVISANVADRDLRGAVLEIRQAIDRGVVLPQGYYVEYGGQFESEQEATQTIGWLTLTVIAGIFLILYMAFRSLRSALIIMVNLPLALIGGVIAVFLTGGILSVASLVGFITLFGIATRNGIMMISHYHHLMEQGKLELREAIVQGSMERLSPVLMTALTAGLALVPLVLRAGEPGNEIQAPMAVVILGGLLSATFLNMIVVPSLYLKFGRPRTAATPDEGL